MKLNKLDIKWLDQPEEHNYPAAESYLSLFLRKDEIVTLIHHLKYAEIVCFKAKDIFRASRLSLLGVSNSHVKKNIKKIKKGIALSPILLVRNKDRVIVADGYHRLCAVYQFNEDIDIPCKIV